MAAYWIDYRNMADAAFQGLGCNKIAIENSEGDWSGYGRILLDFLGIIGSDKDSVVQQNYQRLLGTYRSETEGTPDCCIEIERGNLIADGLPQVWTRTTLIPKSANLYHVQSLPFQVEFLEGERIRMCLTGPTLLDGPVDYHFFKI
ncbi:hypothetical protein [Paenibacillus pinihumi]|uniref:hypothetical protein n=1 Tax=Paenibacillus pinihumi TaxID=669462 RepID=UPI0004912615|nr:hypothetical protein [Paenibacillus pinihumi]